MFFDIIVIYDDSLRIFSKRKKNFRDFETNKSNLFIYESGRNTFWNSVQKFAELIVDLCRFESNRLISLNLLTALKMFNSRQMTEMQSEDILNQTKAMISTVYHVFYRWWLIFSFCVSKRKCFPKAQSLYVAEYSTDFFCIHINAWTGTGIFEKFGTGTSVKKKIKNRNLSGTIKIAMKRLERRKRLKLQVEESYNSKYWRWRIPKIGKNKKLRNGRKSLFS